VDSSLRDYWLKLREECVEFPGILAIKLVRFLDFAQGSWSVFGLLESLHEEGIGIGKVGLVVVVDSPMLVGGSTIVIVIVVVIAFVGFGVGVEVVLEVLVLFWDRGFQSSDHVSVAAITFSKG
jgi:hypothetical protein